MNRIRINLIGKTLAILVFFGLLYGFSSQSAQPLQTENMVMKDIFSVTEADRYLGEEGAVEVTFDPSAGDYTIDRGGRYLLRGNLLGTLYINAEDQHVHLILDNVSIVGTNGPAISVQSAGKVFLTSRENSVNSLGDSPAYELGRSETACVYSTVDLTLNGTGELLITGLYEDAVYCRDTLKVLSSNLTVQSKRDCLRGNDGVLVQGSSLTLEAERNGIRTASSGQDARGDVEIRNAELSVIAGNYCINSASDFYIHRSECFFKGILGVQQVAGEVFAEAGCLPYA